MGQVSIQTYQPTADQENQQPPNPTQTSEILMVQAMDQKGKNKKQKKDKF